jgi:O-antigen ligase
VDFFLFLLVNATLFIRPSELFPALSTIPIYNIVIVLNLVVAAPAIANELSENNLSRSPVTVCVLGVFAFILLSLAVRFEFEHAWDFGFEFAKVIAYFLLIVGTVNTPRRLFTLLGAVAVSTTAVCVLAVLQHHGKINLPSLSEDLDGRMHATGIFGDPNDLSMIIVASIMIFSGGLFYKQFGILRVLLVAPIGFLGYALTLTQSRGGLLALIAGCGAVFYVRFGLVRALALGAVVIPAILAGFGGRQIGFQEALSSGTGRGRVEFWSDGLVALRASPIFGVGVHHYGDHANGMVAHNSFVHAFVELGFFGGALFLGVFGLAGWSLWGILCVRERVNHLGLRHYLPFMAGILVAYAVSMMSLSRPFEVPTYLVAGCAAASQRLAMPGTSVNPPRVNAKMFSILGAAAVGFILCIYLYIKIMFR